MRPNRATLAAFAALALLLGPISGAASDRLASALRFQSWAALALPSAVAGVILLSGALMLRQRLPRRPELLALLLLNLPHWLTHTVNATAALHQPPWAIPLFLALAAPLWLGLLAAAQWIPLDPPRRAIASGLAGLAAACLIVPADAYAVSASQVSVALLHLLLAIFTVFTWSYASRRLMTARLLPCAALFLLLNALAPAVLSLARERPAWNPPDWASAALPILLQATLLAGASSLWFLLLRRLPLAAFSLHPLAAWTASVLSGLVFFGLGNFRADAAFLLAAAGVGFAIRAQPADEQPVTLNLHTR